MIVRKTCVDESKTFVDESNVPPIVITPLCPLNYIFTTNNVPIAKPKETRIEPLMNVKFQQH